ncbi:substrate-binding domain-containing protein [Rathayibacter sp. VKM Ac-2856]|uniref:sugar ABC transporter substrate-binding protein n=1 Tax=unclassified Rathayibacter TaxID=2609250 RepID=UPI0015637338|nr:MULTISPECIES: substrate-binding domain-containing protein [unclassified Rathayibacter]NQX05028.1 substrate-binding domain-containing protein [Rathayibacter sp. VKM Ac-2858]NQX20196.1 substrate-binding domain-containing protein [Rathayibacter sp. VKM Ac-2856]
MSFPTRATGAALAGLASLTLLVGCSASPDGDGDGDAAGGSGSGADIVSLVDASAQTPVDEVVASLGDPTVPEGAKLCYITRTLSNEFWGFERDGFENRAKELGVDYQTFDVTDESSITEQLDKAKSAMNQGCSAILASPISATGLDSIFESALADGIPAVVLNDAKSEVPGVVYVGPDATTIGATAADYIADLLPDGGQVAMIEGDPGSSNAINRGDGFTAALATHENLELVASQTASWDQTKAQEIATTMLTANPDIKAFYSQNDGMALGVQAAIDAKGLTGKVILVGTDGIPQAKKQILAGDYTATVSELPTTEGATGVDAALWLLAGEEVPGWIDVPAFIIDSSNVADYETGMP